MDVFNDLFREHDAYTRAMHADWEPMSPCGLEHDVTFNRDECQSIAWGLMP